MNDLLVLTPYVGLVGLLCSLLLFLLVSKQSPGNERMQEISAMIHDGAMAFLYREYRILAVFIVVVAGLLAWKLSIETMICFICGAIFSILAGYIGMQAATKANSRTSEAARAEGSGAALLVAFGGGSVMGLAVAGLGLLGVGILAQVYGGVEQAVYINGFAMGASSIALFARVGGGIYTKAADVGSDLVGKVEAGIPEDDPRNPATIADNVGDNVGDVAGMGADLYESFVASVLGCMILGVAAEASETLKIRLCLLPLVLAAGGVVASAIGMWFVKVRGHESAQGALNRGTFVAAGLAALFSYPIFWGCLGGETFNGGANANSLFWATVVGVTAGTVIGLLTEY